jgi:hypothetical protein
MRTNEKNGSGLNLEGLRVAGVIEQTKVVLVTLSKKMRGFLSTFM